MTSGRKTRQRRQDQRPAEARWTITVPGATIPASPFPPGIHPGNDKILVVWPDVPPGLDKTALGEWLAVSHPPEAVRTIVDEVTRDEFVRRLAGLDIVSQVNANPLVRVVALVEPAALLRWAASAAEPLERTAAAQFPCSEGGGGRLPMSNGEVADRAADRRTRVDHRVPRELAISGETRRGRELSSRPQKTS